jgi:hypothetical protein
MPASSIAEEAKRLFKLHSSSPAVFTEGGLPPDWSAKVNEALNTPAEDHPKTLLPLLGAFVQTAAKIYTPEWTVEHGINQVAGPQRGLVMQDSLTEPKPLETPDQVFRETSARVLNNTANVPEMRSSSGSNRTRRCRTK